jgi:cytochrome b561
MTPLDNSNRRYGAIAMLFHWSMAAIIVGLAVLGLYMVALPDVGFTTLKVTLVIYHKEFGLLAFTLLAMRLSWRITHTLPELVEMQPEWQKIAARFLQLFFYGLIAALPMSGYLMSSAAGIPVSLFGLYTLPDLAHRNDDLFRRYAFIHQWLSYLLIACICAHVAAALKHHFVDKDDTLRNMLP